MKQPNPLVPQGSFESQGRRKSHVRLAVFTILAIHVVVLGALLIQGCKREEKDTTALNPPTNDTSTAVQPFTNAITDVVTTPPPPTNVPQTTTTVPPINAPPPNVALTPPSSITETPPTTSTEHTIVRGDNFSTLATKYGVSVKAIQDANPNLQPTRLKVGDKVKIPAKTASMAANGTGGGATAATDTYTVKSGDTLSKVAKDHGTTVKELQRLNSLTTTQIRVGQKLKLPQRAAAPAGGVSPAP